MPPDTHPPTDKLLAKSKITSKGQITLPLEVRNRLGVTTGDTIQFVVDPQGRTLVLPAREQEDPFAQFVGVAPLPPEYEDSVAWLRDLRDDDYEAEQTHKRRNMDSDLEKLPPARRA